MVFCNIIASNNGNRRIENPNMENRIVTQSALPVGNALIQPNPSGQRVARITTSNIVQLQYRPRQVQQNQQVLIPVGSLGVPVRQCINSQGEFNPHHVIIAQKEIKKEIKQEIGSDNEEVSVVPATVAPGKAPRRRRAPAPKKPYSRPARQPARASTIVENTAYCSPADKEFYEMKKFLEPMEIVERHMWVFIAGCRILLSIPQHPIETKMGNFILDKVPEPARNALSAWHGWTGEYQEVMNTPFMEIRQYRIHEQAGGASTSNGNGLKVPKLEPL